MRLLISDYSGHPFQVQLSRKLAQMGHQVCHVTSASFQTPKGRLEADGGDPSSLEIVGVRTSTPFAKDSFFKRRAQEIEIGTRVAEQIAGFCPDVVISSNAPLDTQRQIQRATRRAGAAFIFWVQDLYSEAISRILRARLGVLGAAVGAHYRRLEARMLHASDHIVVIAEDFIPAVRSLAGAAAEKITVIENWAPIDNIDLLPRDNPWAAANLPDAPLRLIYSGTLGFKHNPELLFRLAEGTGAEVIVFSEGPAAESLRSKAENAGLGNLQVRNWLPFDDLPHALAGADILVVILEPDAGIFSVPSKVLTYMCVGRPILAAVPQVNLAARLVSGEGAGMIVEPDDLESFVEAARRLAGDGSVRDRMGTAARSYAERVFDIDAIAARFETIAKQSLESGPPKMNASSEKMT